MSITIAGLIIALLGSLANKLGFVFNVSDTELVRIVEVVGQFGGLALAYWGRYRKGDINPLGMRKPNDITIDGLPE